MLRRRMRLLQETHEVGNIQKPRKAVMHHIPKTVAPKWKVETTAEILRCEMAYGGAMKYLSGRYEATQ